MILQKLLPIKIGSKQIEYYSSLGYNVKTKETCLIKNEDVLAGSTVEENRQCDICGMIYTKKHRAHVITFSRFNQDVCPCCVRNNEAIKQITKHKRMLTVQEHYGADNPSQSLMIQEKKEQTLALNYGVTNPMKNADIQHKAQQTSLQKYGVLIPAQSEEVKEKAKETCLQRYGVEYTAQIPESRIKANESYYKHGTQKISSQQFAIFTLLQDNNYEVVLNYPLSSLSLDIYLKYNNMHIDIEYDGNYWHQDKQKDRRRDEFVKSQGYKVLRIKSDKNIPTITQIEEALVKLNDHNFCKIEI